MKNIDRNRKLASAFNQSIELSPDNNCRSISPISQNEGKVNPFISHFKTCTSRERSNNVTPPSNFYSVQTLNTNRNSVVECNNCTKLEKKLKSAQFNLNKLKEKQQVSSKHLNQYESLLKIKENRLNEREKVLAEHLLQLENEKIKVFNDKSFSLTENEQRSRITCASNSPILQKNQEFSIKSEIPKKNQATSTESQENSTEIKIFEYFQQLYKIKQENLELKEAEILKVKQEILQEQEKIKSDKEKISNDNILIEKKLKKIEDQAQELTLLKSRLENETFDFEKSRNELESETKILRESFEAKLQELESLKLLSESRISTEHIQKPSPGKVSEFNLEPLDELSFGKVVYTDSGKYSEGISSRNNEFSQSLKGFANAFKDPVLSERENPNKTTYISRDSQDELSKFSLIEQIRARFDQKTLEYQHQLKLKDLFHLQETEKLQISIQELESQVENLQNQNSQLQVNNEHLNLKLLKFKKKKKDLKKAKGFDQLDEMIDTLEEKVRLLKEKEEEITNFKRHLACEQETLMNEAECLKILYQEMNKEKIVFFEEKEELFGQKKALIEIEKIHQEKIELLGIKEKELAKLKDELLAKENNLRKYYTRTIRIPKRVNTHQGDLTQECLIFK